MTRVVFAGTPAFAVPSLTRLIDAAGMQVVGVISQPDRPAGRGMKLTPSPVRQCAAEHGIEVVTPEHLRGNDEALSWLQAMRPDVLVVVAFGMLLPRAWLDTPPHGAVNVHASLLPRWRGAAPIERAILAGDTETGVCIMRMEAGLDTGAIYASASVPILADTTAGALRDRLAELGADLLLATLPGMIDGRILPAPQDDGLATYAHKLVSSDRCVDWAWPAAQVDRCVRAFAPSPSARTRLHGKWLKILDGELRVRECGGAAGAIDAQHGYLDVSCGEGSYRIRRLQAEGKKPVAAADFLRGLQAETLERFDSPDTIE